MMFHRRYELDPRRVAQVMASSAHDMLLNDHAVSCASGHAMYVHGGLVHRVACRPDLLGWGDLMGCDMVGCPGGVT